MKETCYIEVTVQGNIDEVYTTETGMNIADSETHSEGWKQITKTTRRKVRSKALTTHAPHLHVWEFVTKE